jgi:Fe-S-cluster-containing hydrogenase component 2
MQKILFVDPEKCTGCRLCETVCSMHHEKVLDLTKARIHVVKWETAGLYIPIICQQCDDPICETVCPVKAMKHDVKTGAIQIDYNLCVGCRLCVQMCPFGGVEINSKAGKVFKCDLCQGEPTCVKFCDPKALQYLNATAVNVKKRRAAAERYSELMKKLLATP